MQHVEHRQAIGHQAEGAEGATSYGYAMTTYAGQNLGAGKLDRISHGMKAGLTIALATSAVISRWFE